MINLPYFAIISQMNVSFIIRFPYINDLHVMLMILMMRIEIWIMMCK